MLELDPAVQKIAREDDTGRLRCRHLYPLTQLTPISQRQAIAKIQRDGLTAAQVERLAAEMKDDDRVPRKRGAPVKQLRFRTGAASVTVTFRKRDVSTTEVAAALDEARAQVEASSRPDAL